MFNNIEEIYKNTPHCLLCKKPMQFYIAGYQRIPYYSQEYVYLKTKIEDNLLKSLREEYPVTINIRTNEILQGQQLISNLLISHFDFYQTCNTCTFQINYQFLSRYINGNLLPTAALLKEELVYTINSKKVVIYSHYDDKYKYAIGPIVYDVHDDNFDPGNGYNTYVYVNDKHISSSKFKISNFKNIKKLNNFIKTLLIFG
jgi:hypothetical protein